MQKQRNLPAAVKGGEIMNARNGLISYAMRTIGLLYMTQQT